MKSAKRKIRKQSHCKHGDVVNDLWVIDVIMSVHVTVALSEFAQANFSISLTDVSSSYDG